jgi:HEPN domain-containing protein
MVKGIQFLKKRAQEFWEAGKRFFNEGKYNLSAFHLEQAVQLWIKYLIGIKIGDWPKTHYLSELIKELVRAWDERKFLEFYQQKELFFDDLEDAYFVSRYFPKEFTQNGVSQLIENAQEFLRLTEEITKEKFFNA